MASNRRIGCWRCLGPAAGGMIGRDTDRSNTRRRCRDEATKALVAYDLLGARWGCTPTRRYARSFGWWAICGYTTSRSQRLTDDLVTNRKVATSDLICRRKSWVRCRSPPSVSAWVDSFIRSILEGGCLLRGSKTRRCAKGNKPIGVRYCARSLEVVAYGVVAAST